MSGSLPDWFGGAYRDAVFDANAPGEVLRLQQVLVDWAYTNRSFVITASKRSLCEAARLHGRSLERARDWLAGRGLLEFEVAKRGRGLGSRYELRLPDTVMEKAAQARPSEGPEKAASKAALKAAEKAASKAAHARPKSLSKSYSGEEDALTRVGPQKEDRNISRDLHVRTNRRRGGLTNEDVRAIRLRLEAEEAAREEENDDTR